MQLFIGPRVERLIDLALEEDEVGLDVTSAAFFGDGDECEARIVAREKLVMAGTSVAKAVFERVDPAVRYSAESGDGQTVESGAIMARIEGAPGALLRAERVALNFLQRMCGVATWTRAHVDALADADTRVVDTRKTLPGWRSLDKYAVRCGGGRNHRLNLSGGVMIKENHIAAAGGVEEAIERVRSQAPHTLRVEVEVERLDQVMVAVEAGADVVLLDNMDNETMTQAVASIREHRRGDDVVIEGSGNMDQPRLATLAEVGLDVVSVGALTHSAPAVDISMRIDDVGRRSEGQ